MLVTSNKHLPYHLLGLREHENHRVARTEQDQQLLCLHMTLGHVIHAGVDGKPTRAVRLVIHGRQKLLAFRAWDGMGEHDASEMLAHQTRLR